MLICYGAVHNRSHHHAPQGRALKGRVLPPGDEIGRVDYPLRLRVEHGHVRGRANLEGARESVRQAKDAGGAGRQPVDEGGQSQPSAMRQGHKGAEGNLQPAYAEGRLLKAAILVPGWVGRVVRGYALDYAVPQPFHHRVDVPLGPQRGG